ncbi:hypothetical protein [Glutamicibacter creatinolyticus]|uniref:hypothetical protein n=1 Tax=Glutamicibacter creatinolyticus TaxID=162496 RepID=UPI001585F0BC|nr:hypothetical protein [Glutamicibacter creatinolyticus]
MSYRDNPKWQQARQQLCDGLTDATPDEILEYRLAAIRTMFQIEVAYLEESGGAAA